MKIGSRAHVFTLEYKMSWLYIVHRVRVALFTTQIMFWMHRAFITITSPLDISSTHSTIALLAVAYRRRLFVFFSIMDVFCLRCSVSFHVMFVIFYRQWGWRHSSNQRTSPTRTRSSCWHSARSCSTPIPTLRSRWGMLFVFVSWMSCCYVARYFGCAVCACFCQGLFDVKLYCMHVLLRSIASEWLTFQKPDECKWQTVRQAVNCIGDLWVLKCVRGIIIAN